MTAKERCSNPWCRGTDTDCGRTPQQHLEEGLTVGELYDSLPEGDKRTIVFDGEAYTARKWPEP